MVWYGKASAWARPWAWKGFRTGKLFDSAIPFQTSISRDCLFAKPSGLGGEQEDVEDDQLHLSGKRDVSRPTFTAGKMSAKDVFDNNAYANDPRTQFMNWALMANEAWDYPTDSRPHALERVYLR